MFNRTVLLTVICFCVAGSVAAQERLEKRKIVTPPNDTYLIAVASQPDCPIQIENAKLQFAVTGGSSWGASYRLRNAGTTPLSIRSITLAMWTVSGAGATWQELIQDSQKPVLPQALIPLRQFNSTTENVPLTDEIRDQMKLRGPLRAVVVLLVEQITFSDGSLYSDEATSKALQAYFQNVDVTDKRQN
ncbi:MAG TPA: hypothetical protein VJU84_01875 [Pyrinomonadaceae bacterium]|nr:hypothetical protein [Pyrinomonadaceae bacterium]